MATDTAIELEVPPDAPSGPSEEPTHAGVAVMAHDTGRILLIQRSLDQDDAPEVQGTWEFPGGTIEDGEGPEEAAWREFSEETGLPRPDGETVNGWRSDDGVYQGFLFLTPTEADAFDALNPDADAADVDNPDDPGRRNPDISAWFSLEQMQNLGPALRPEVAAMDWSVFDLEEDMPTDTEPAEVEASNDIAPVPWYGIIAPEGVPSGDKRMFADGSLRTRPLPIPLTWQKVSANGHDGNVTVAMIEKTWRQNGKVWGSGHFLQTPEADEAVALVAAFGRYGVSVDADDIDEFALEVSEDGIQVFTDARQCSACIVSIPAFAEAFVALGEFDPAFADEERPPSSPIPDADEADGDCSCDPDDENYSEDCECDEGEPEDGDVEVPAEIADEFSAGVEGRHPLQADLVDPASHDVAGMADQSTDLPRPVVMIDHEGGPLSASLVVASPVLSLLAAEGATARLLIEQGIPVFASDSILASQRGISPPSPSLVIGDDVRGAGSGTRADAEAAVRSATAVPLIEVGVGADLAAGPTDHWTLVVDRDTGNAHSAYLTPFRDVSQAERDRLMKEGKALRPDGSFPIANCEDLKNAIQAIGRASDPDAAKRLIRRRHGELDCDVELPDTWAVTADGDTEAFLDVAPGITEDGPGWLTHPVDTDRLRDYWVRGAGAAKIGWGTPGDFNRCRVNLAEYIKPQHLSGYCANRHFDALGYWPGQGPHAKGEVMEMSESTEVVESLTAAAPRQGLPAEWFADPGLDGPTPLTLTEEGRVFGHLASWGVCHIGFQDECVEAPHSLADYAYFRTGEIVTDGGPVPVGNISMGGGHADPTMGLRPAMAHYDSTSAVIADIAVGEDAHGIWFSGALRANVSEDDLSALAASGGLSGDWRAVRGNLELVAALAVNVPGFPVPRIGLAASAGQPTALVAAGVVLAEEGIGEDEFTERVAARVKEILEVERQHAALRQAVGGEALASLRERIGN